MNQNLLARHSHSSVPSTLDLLPPPASNTQGTGLKKTKPEWIEIIYFYFKLFKIASTPFMVYFTTALEQMNHYGAFYALLKINFPLLHLGCGNNRSWGQGYHKKICNNHVIYVSDLHSRAHELICFKGIISNFSTLWGVRCNFKPAA